MSRTSDERHRGGAAPPLRARRRPRDSARISPRCLTSRSTTTSSDTRIAEDAGILNALIDATRAGHDLTPCQWAQWYSVALGFRPDLIVELGRAKGNSTALFCQAASRLGGTRVVSLCNSRDWVDDTLPRLRTVVPAGWFDPLDARTATSSTWTTRALVQRGETRAPALGRARFRDCRNRARA